MAFIVYNLLFLSSLSSLALAVPSNVQPRGPRAPGKPLWDGRIPNAFPKTDFDSYSTSKYNPEYVRGSELWSEIIEYPSFVTAPASLFDYPNTRSIEVTLNDESVFVPGGNPQKGFRRAELLPIVNNGTDSTVQGITTFHFSIIPDPYKPLNYSHQYELVFYETNDYASHVWTLKTGTPFGVDPGTFPPARAHTIRLGSSTAGGAAEVVLYEVPFPQNTWHNFAVQTNWVKSTITVWYSTDYNPLRLVVGERRNDATGKGQAHVGVLKLPTGNPSNPSQEGYQPFGINEGVIYGGIFVEDTSANPPIISPKH